MKSLITATVLGALAAPLAMPGAAFGQAGSSGSEGSQSTRACSRLLDAVRSGEADRLGLTEAQVEQMMSRNDDAACRQRLSALDQGGQPQSQGRQAQSDPYRDPSQSQRQTRTQLQERSQSQSQSPYRDETSRTGERAAGMDQRRSGERPRSAAGAQGERQAELQDGQSVDIEAEGRVLLMDPQPRVRVEQSEPRVTVRQPQPQVDVTQAPPQVIVREAQPTITVQMPRPIISIEQPEPEIIVRMQQPDINLAMADPEVEVRQEPPRVQVTQPPAEVRLRMDEEGNVPQQSSEADIEVQRAPPRVTVQRAEGQPQIRYSQGDPEVSFEAAGQPRVQFEGGDQEPEIRYTRTGERQVRVLREGESEGEEGMTRQMRTQEQAGEAQRPPSERRTGSRPRMSEEGEVQSRYDEVEGEPAPRSIVQSTDRDGQLERGAMESTIGIDPGESAQTAQPGTRLVTVERLLDMDVVNATGTTLGDVSRVIESGGNSYIVVASGGFLGLGEREVALPLDDLEVVDDRLVAPGYTDEDLERMREIDPDDYPALDEQRKTALRVR
ncbi:MAG: PRC-barrel domain-containing protein [Alphaproteobacteria bacterium]|nr:PRC-barrel domain-containing protein [Alphaproteobacteria bacterium]